MVVPAVLVGLRGLLRARKYRERQIARRLADCLAHGVTTVRDASSLDYPLGRNRALREAISAGDMRGPRILQAVVVSQANGYLVKRMSLAMRLSSRLLGMPSPDYENEDAGAVVFPLNATRQQVRDAVDRAVDERGADCIKIAEQLEDRSTYKPDATIMTFDQLQALADQARRRGVRTTMHHVTVESFRRAVRAGVSSLVHLPLDNLLTEEDVEDFVEAGCMIEPTLSLAFFGTWKVKQNAWRHSLQMDRLAGFRNQVYPGLTGEYWVPGLSGGARKGLDRLRDGKTRVFGVIDMSNVFGCYPAMISRGLENARMLFNGGAVMGCANDAGMPPLMDGMVGLELALFDLFLNDDGGETRFKGADALRTATISSARALGMEASLGSIDAGKTADLVVMDGDPFEDFRVIGSPVAALFKGGRLIINKCGLTPEPVHQS